MEASDDWQEEQDEDSDVDSQEQTAKGPEDEEGIPAGDMEELVEQEDIGRSIQVKSHEQVQNGNEGLWHSTRQRRPPDRFSGWTF